MKRRIWLSIDQCPIHRYWAISLVDETGGVRLTDSKCCGRWDTAHKFAMTPSKIQSIIDALVIEPDRLAEE